MSFGFREEGRPSLRDRFRGKSSDQILEELRKKLDKDKEMFFDRVPAAPSFRRAGFPFDDDGLTSRGRPDFRHRLEELAHQHPEFADSLRPWYEQQQQHQQHPAGPFRQRTSSNSSQPRPEQQHQQHQAPPHPAPQGPQQQHEAAPEAPRPQQPDQAEEQPAPRGIAHHGLRNTVDLGEAQAQAQADMDADERGKRAQSAPPSGPAPDQGSAGNPRFVSRLDINPQPAPSSQDPAAAKPPTAPKSSSNVRQIPIFVEGRDEPVLSKHDVDSTNFGQGFGHVPHHPFAGHQGFSRPHGGGHGGIHDSARFGDAPRAQGFPSFHGRDQFDGEAPAQKRPFHQQHQQPPPPPPRHPQPQRSQPQPQHQAQPPRQPTPPQQPPRQATPPAPPREAPKPKDALEKVKDVRDEVESLAKQVDEFAGAKQDKQYLFLDEMLTRELIKLDVIETEGRDDVRAARKEAIRAIQQCISKLESKAGTPSAAGADQQAMEVEQAAQQPKEEAMEVEPASSQPSEDSKTEAAAPATAEATTPAVDPAAATAAPPAGQEGQTPSQVPAGPSNSTDSQPTAMDTTPASEAATATTNPSAEPSPATPASGPVPGGAPVAAS